MVENLTLKDIKPINPLHKTIANIRKVFDFQKVLSIFIILVRINYQLYF